MAHTSCCTGNSVALLSPCLNLRPRFHILPCPQVYVAGEFVGGADIVESMYNSGASTFLSASAQGVQPVQPAAQGVLQPRSLAACLLVIATAGLAVECAAPAGVASAVPLPCFSAAVVQWPLAFCRTPAAAAGSGLAKLPSLRRQGVLTLHTISLWTGCRRRAQGGSAEGGGRALVKQHPEARHAPAPAAAPGRQQGPCIATTSGLHCIWIPVS